MLTKEETNICKGIAIIMMLFHHLFNDFEEYAGFVVDYSPFTAERLTFLAILRKICVAILSKICVAIFVFLSGYGMAYTYRRKFDSRKPEKKEICSYIWNRYWKVMSGYWFVFLFALLCQPLGRTVVEAYGTSIKEILLYFLVDFLGLSYLLSTPTLNPTWWYMSIAVFIIFLMPFIMRLMQKYGAITVLVVLTAGINLTGTANASTFYLFSLLLGATCLETGFFERLMQSGNKNYMNKTVLIFCEIVCFFLLLQYRTNYNINGIIDGLIALVITSFVHTFIGKISGVSQIMQFLGKHSMNIFLTHTLLYSYYFLGFFYSFRHWFLILMVLLLVSILVSVVIEKMKEKTGYVQKMAELIKNGEKMEFSPLKIQSEIQPQFPKEKYCGMVEKAKEYIREGDIFQVVLSNPMRAKAQGSLFDTYRVLRASNPSPYMFYFSSDDIEIAGASPETLVSLKNKKLSTFPLAGTRPRGKNRQEDQELERELLQDEKERAEHNMLVDLGRNDIGKISQIGSVEVEKYMSIEHFSHVMHIGSTVTGTLRNDKDAVDAVDAILPAGTLSGAPKFRACQIIEELEQSKRGIYGGAIGYLDFAGNLDTCIAIRLVYKKNGSVCIRSGAGIVADSVPEKEFEECCNKARAVVQAIRQAQEGLE